MGLTDRGQLDLGKRADVIAVNAKTREVEMAITAGRLVHLSGEVARRFRV
jgi:alpha-D-ribose 1-methylphosphonate 5-triphosphate diphosphatase